VIRLSYPDPDLTSPARRWCPFNMDASQSHASNRHASTMWTDAWSHFDALKIGGAKMVVGDGAASCELKAPTAAAGIEP